MSHIWQKKTMNIKKKHDLRTNHIHSAQKIVEIG